jgi:transposase InsO family protein
VERKKEFLNIVHSDIRKSRSNNGGEYTSVELVVFCKAARIRRELIVPHNPQQNRVVERKNQPLKNLLRKL